MAKSQSRAAHQEPAPRQQTAGEAKRDAERQAIVAKAVKLRQQELADKSKR